MKCYVPIDDAQRLVRQHYAHIDMDLKHPLRDKLDAIAPEYGMIELTYPSFACCYGYED